MQNLTVVSVAFRQNEFINAAIRSVDKNLKSANVVKYLIIDNSKIVPFKIHEDICGKNAASKIEVVRNYIGYNRKIQFFRDHSHSKGILKAIELCKTDLMLLIDHDIILKNDIDFIDDVACSDNVIAAFSIRNRYHPGLHKIVRRAAPFLMLLDVAKLKKHNIQFYDSIYSNDMPAEYYITGWQFLKNLENQTTLKYRVISNLNYYINHYLCGHKANLMEQLKFISDNRQYLI